MSTPASPSQKRTRRWPRRLGWALAIVLALRLVLALAAGPIARAVLARQGLDLRYERLELELLKGRVELWRLEAAPVAEGDEEAGALFFAQTLDLDVDMKALFRGHVRVRRLEVDGARIELERRSDGTWNLEPLLAGFGGGEEEARPDASEPEEPGPIVLEPPIEVLAARLQDVSVHVRDATADPPVEAELKLSLTAADVGSPDRRARLDVVATSPQLLDVLRVRGSATTAGATADVDLEVELARLRLQPLGSLLLPLGIEGLEGPLDGGFVLRVEVRPLDESEERVTATLELRDARLVHAGREALALDTLDVDVSEAWSDGARVGEVLIEGVRARLLRLADGAPAVAGIAWRGRSAQSGNDAEPPPQTGRSEPESDATPGFTWSIQSVRVRDGLAVLEDRGFVPAHEVKSVLDELRLGPLGSSADGEDARLELAASLPDVVERLALGGTLRPLADPPAASLHLEADGITHAGLAPYLALLGAEPALADGSFRIDSIELGGAAEGGSELAVRGLELHDAGEELAAVDGLVLTMEPGAAPRCVVEGTRVRLTREEEETLAVLGLRLGASPAVPPRAAAAASTEAEAADERTPFEVPRLDLPTLALELERLLLLDEATGAPPHAIGPLTLAVRPAGGAVDDTRAWELTCDGRGGAVGALAAHARLQQAAAGELRLAGEGEARTIELEALRPWLSLAGLEPALEDGSLTGAFTLVLEARDGHPALDLELGPVRLVESAGASEREWLGLDRLAIEGFVLGDAVTVDDVRLESPRLALQRDEDGGVRLLGLRVPPPAAETTAAQAAADAPVAVEVEPEGGEPPAARAPRIEHLQLAGARLRLDDLALPTPHVLELEADLSLAGLAPEVGASPTTLEGRLAIGPWRLGAGGEIVLDPDDLRASLALSGEGLCGDPLAPYLPAGIEAVLREGLAAAQLDVRLARGAEGGRTVALRLDELDLRERDAEHPLAALSSLRVSVPRLDLDGGVLAVEELAVEGASLSVVRAADGGIDVLGVRIGSPSETVSVPAPAQSDAEDAAQTTATAEPLRLSRLSVERLDLELAELRVTSEAFPAAAPALFAGRVALREPLRLEIDPQAEEIDLPTIGLDLEARVVPGVESLDLALDLAPFADRPRVDGTLAVRGLSGEGLLAFAPELASDVDPKGLTEGTFDAAFGAELTFRRRDPLDFDLGAGFGASVSVRDVALRRAPEEEIALGVDVVEALVRRIAPQAGLVHVREVLIDTPRARVRRTDEGVELAGVVLRLPGPGSAPEEAPADEGDGTAEATASETVVVAEDGPATAFRLDQLVVQGIDVRLEDTSVEPAFVLPLETLDVEVRGFEARALREPVPIRFSASLGAGPVPVPVPVRMEQASLLRGMASGLAGVVSSSDDQEVSYEERPFFEEASVSGRLALAPVPKGWVRASLSAFELTALRGPAREGGVEIGDGLLDFRGRIRLDGEEGGSVTSVTSFSDLSLSEPDGGPISRYLKLPAPLDAVLFALKNERGEHRLPLDFELGAEGGINSAAIATKASATLLGLITEALASAPVRAVGGVTDVVGLGGLFGGGDGGSRYAGRTALLPFAAGDAHVRELEAAGFDEIVAAMEADPLLEVQAIHLFASGDLARAERLASPDSEETRNLLRSLRLRRAELGRRRDELSVLARSQLLLGKDVEFAGTRVELVAADRDLGLVEEGIDLVAELLRPGSESRRDRRTRQAALAIAEARLEGVQRELLDAGVAYERCDLRPPRYELPTEAVGEDERGRVILVTKGGTPPKGFFRRIFGWIGF